MKGSELIKSVREGMKSTVPGQSLDGNFVKPLRSIPVFYLVSKKRPGRLGA